jgi:hypothetical protein
MPRDSRGRITETGGTSENGEGNIRLVDFVVSGRFSSGRNLCFMLSDAKSGQERIPQLVIPGRSNWIMDFFYSLSNFL